MQNNNRHQPQTLAEYQEYMRRRDQLKQASRGPIGNYVAKFDGGDWFFVACVAMVLIATGVVKVVMLAFGLAASIWIHVIKPL